MLHFGDHADTSNFLGDVIGFRNLRGSRLQCHGYDSDAVYSKRFGLDPWDNSDDIDDKPESDWRARQRLGWID